MSVCRYKQMRHKIKITYSPLTTVVNHTNSPCAIGPLRISEPGLTPNFANCTLFVSTTPSPHTTYGILYNLSHLQRIEVDTNLTLINDILYMSTGFNFPMNLLELFVILIRYFVVGAPIYVKHFFESSLNPFLVVSNGLDVFIMLRQYTITTSVILFWCWRYLRSCS